MLTEDEFNILYNLLKVPGSTQRELSKINHISLGKVNSLMKLLEEQGLVVEEPRNEITETGKSVLAPYKVKNAIIMAAGMSSRFAPLSYEKPKALMVVKGEIMIERQIRQLQEAGITDITVVVGYLKEKLYYLADKFNVHIVVNEDYYRYNNTSTLLLVADRLDNTYICSSDNYFTENPFEDYVYRAYYSAVYAPGWTEEYCLTCNRKGRITGVSHGGEASWFMEGHVYFDRAFSRKFVEILKEEYRLPITRSQLWEDLYIRHIGELEMYIRKYDDAVIKEFDSLDDLRKFDEHYLDNTDSPIFHNICRVLSCHEKDIHGIKPLKVGMTNLSFVFECKGRKYVYRHPGVGTDAYIDRQSEAASMKIAKELHLDDTFIYMEPQEGWKISSFIPDAATLDYHKPEQVECALEMIRTLHASGKTTSHSIDIWKQIETFEQALAASGRDGFEGAGTIRLMIGRLRDEVNRDHVEPCICHGDCYSPNFLVDQNGKMYLIDWEYSGMADPAVDLGTFITCSDYSIDKAEEIIRSYFRKDISDSLLRHFIAYTAILSYYWFIWSLYQDSIGKSVGEWSYIWYRHTKSYGEKAVEMYESREGNE